MYDVKGQYPDWSNPEHKAIDSKVEWITYFDRNYRCELFDKEPIAGGVRKHNYGMIPYVSWTPDWVMWTRTTTRLSGMSGYSGMLRIY